MRVVCKRASILGRRVMRAGCAAATLWTLQAGAAMGDLPGYNINPDDITISGISSGAYMAVQFGVAHSATVRGVGAIAGGPYACSGGRQDGATGVCMVGPPQAEPSLQAAREAEAEGRIDPLKHLATQRVWMLNGYNDGVVRRPVTDVLQEFYRQFTPASQLFYKTNINAAHAQVTTRYGRACNYTGGAFVNRCDYDAAGMILQHLYGRLDPPASGRLRGTWVRFSQKPFHPADPWLIGLSHEGFAYVPQRCAAGQPCRLHVALHGCKQYAALIGDRYYAQAGYNEWADTNGLVVLYPQTTVVPPTLVSPGTPPGNPNGCWDWWGFTGPAYAEKSAPQIQAIRAMVERISSGYAGAAQTARAAPAPMPALAAQAPVLAATDATDASVSLAWSAVPGAAGFNLYRADCADCSPQRVNENPIQGHSFADHGLAARTAYTYIVRAVDRDGVEGPQSSPSSRSTTQAPPPCDPYRRNNIAHWQEGRADINRLGQAFAKGSKEPMGMASPLVETLLIQVRPGHFRVNAPCQ
jgi:poly(3-hydroxybutyrate) depolymerase